MNISRTFEKTLRSGEVVQLGIVKALAEFSISAYVNLLG